MKFVKSMLAGLFIAVSSFLPFLPASKALAVRPDLDSQVLLCNVEVFDDGEEGYKGGTDSCDLSIKKYVSVNGGAINDADTASDAPIYTTGNSVTWTIEVTNASPRELGVTPGGEVKITDVLPAGVTLVSSGMTSGAFADNTWHIDLTAHSYFMLTLVTTANSTGTVQNTATLSQVTHDFDPETLDTNPDNFVSYEDSNAANNSDSAFIRTASVPQVLGSSTSSTPQVQAASTLAETGSATPIIAAVTFIATTAGLLFTVRRRRFVKYVR